MADHPECGEDVAELIELPCRVLCVAGTGQDPYLLTTNGKRAHYATLSHCWGGSLTVMTTKASLLQRERGIPMDTLPKTYRDAIMTCRKLDILYLWIDSLCIIQDDMSDWERHSGMMGTIYQNSTLTLSANDASNSSKGLFIPCRPHDKDAGEGFITLPLSFGDHKGQVYLTSSSWGLRGSVSNVENGILQQRGWVIQERYLSRRKIHFLEGHIVWECCNKIIEQSGFNEPFRNTWERCFLAEMRTWKRALEHRYNLCDGDKDEKIVEKTIERKESLASQGEGDVNTPHWARIQRTQRDEGGIVEGTENSDLNGSEKGRRAYIVDLRNEADQTPPPISLTRKADPDLYTFLDEASSKTVYHLWYWAVGEYSRRRLTFSSDKLPAMAGIASRVHDITKDQYLAGHWRKELERSLFWWTRSNSDYFGVRCVKPYRAPSWSWASMDEAIYWDFAELAPRRDSPAAIQIIDAQVDVKGENPFGTVEGGRLIMQASVVRATWHAAKHGWILDGNFLGCGPGDWNSFHFYSIDKTGNEQKSTDAGYWTYDNYINAIMPGPVLTSSTSEVEIQARILPRNYDFSTDSANTGDDLLATPIWKRGTYVPEELVLVKGPTKTLYDWYPHLHGGRESIVEVLVLAKTGDREAEFRRVGFGKLGSWDKEVETVETLTVV